MVILSLIKKISPYFIVKYLLLSVLWGKIKVGTEGDSEESRCCKQNKRDQLELVKQDPSALGQSSHTN